MELPRSPLRSQQRARSRSQAESLPQQPPSPQPPPRPVSPKLLASPAKLPAPQFGFLSAEQLPAIEMLSEATATASRGYGGSQYTVKHWHFLVEQLHTKVCPCNSNVVCKMHKMHYMNALHYCMLLAHALLHTYEP
jgi:hypothetical protein